MGSAASKDRPAGLDRLTRALAGHGAGSGHNARPLPPVERWNPPFCGDIDMRIASDGTWFYLGTPIGRPELVKLFSSVLKYESGRFFLVTPVEKVGITVDDAPFQAVEMAVSGSGRDRDITFRTNVDDIVAVAPAHPLRFVLGADGGLKPYLHVRRDLWARVTRALTYDLIELCAIAHDGTERMFGLQAGGAFWPAARAEIVEGLT